MNAGRAGQIRWQMMRGLGTATAAAVLLAAGTAQAATPSLATDPPAAICGNDEILRGPATAPDNAVVVRAGNNADVNFDRPGATFWFAPGIHTLGDDKFDQIIARDKTTFVGGPGAVLDGQHRNLYAFTGAATDVTIKHLTIRNFGRGMDNNNEGVVNHDAGARWTIEANTITGNDGAGIFLGSGGVARSNCLAKNGQYGFSMYADPADGDSAIKNIVLDHNEIAGNNTDDWESHIEGCGCTGGGKFWDVLGARVTNNWVHDNKGTGLWADTNNIDFLIAGNLIEDNDGEGVWYEISYNATIRDNLFRRNGWVAGRSNTGSPAPAIYLSESGGDARLPSTVSGSTTLRIQDNTFVDNFSGVSIYENANRFCNSNGNTSKGYCTPFVRPTLIAEPHDYDYPNPISTDHPCYGRVAEEPYRTDCRWHAKNVEVAGNHFRFDDTVVPCTGTFCGAQALYATGSDNIPWAPYTVAGVQADVMFNNNNRFHDNHYVGNWRFAKGYGETVRFATWRAAPYHQEAGSTIEGETSPIAKVPNDLDADTSTLEGSRGRWAGWYNATATRTTAEAHTGKAGLQVDVTGDYWGVRANNWPTGYATTPGLKAISLWGKALAGTGLRPKLRVTWLDAGHHVLRTDDVQLPALTSAWQRAAALVDPPAGVRTALVAVAGTGRSGNRLVFDDVVVGDAPNVLDAGTSGGETSAGVWQGWYSADIGASTEQVYKGLGSLKVSVTEPWGWAVQVSNWPGFDVTPGPKRISYVAQRGVGALADVKLRLTWYGTDQQQLQTDDVPLATTTTWRRASADVVAPAGVATVTLTLLTGSGAAGDTLYVDDVVVTDRP